MDVFGERRCAVMWVGVFLRIFLIVDTYMVVCLGCACPFLNGCMCFFALHGTRINVCMRTNLYTKQFTHTYIIHACVQNQFACEDAFVRALYMFTWPHKYIDDVMQQYTYTVTMYIHIHYYVHTNKQSNKQTHALCIYNRTVPSSPVTSWSMFGSSTSACFVYTHTYTTIISPSSR